MAHSKSSVVLSYRLQAHLDRPHAVGYMGVAGVELNDPGVVLHVQGAPPYGGIAIPLATRVSARYRGAKTNERS